VLLQVALAMFRASQGHRWQGRTTKTATSAFEAEDAASGVTGRHERGERRLMEH
jgi:hypothetical protein